MGNHLHPPHPAGDSMPLPVMRRKPIHGEGADADRPLRPMYEVDGREMEALPMKSPVSDLKKLLARRGTVPKYQMASILGPTFVYEVAVDGHVAIGTGSTAAAAKLSAAIAMLEKLTGTVPADQNCVNETLPETERAGAAERGPRPRRKRSGSPSGHTEDKKRRLPERSVPSSQGATKSAPRTAPQQR